VKASFVWRFEGSAEQDEDIHMAAAGFIFLASQAYKKNKTRGGFGPV